jgi:histidinol-phosphate aminotransferase
MAGLRIGYAIAHPDTVARMEALMMGGNITPSVTSLAAAMAAIGDDEFINYCKDQNDEARQIVYGKFQSWGVEYIASSTNFIFFRTDRFGGGDIVRPLADRNVMIRSYSDVPGWARVSMGTLDEMHSFIAAAQELLT